MRLPVLLASLLIASAASAAQFTVQVPEVDDATALESTYDCSGKELIVTYYNAGDVSLARFEWEGKTVVASAVISGSGVRYAGNQWIWWTQGDEGSLYDAMKGDDAEAVATCKSTD